MSTYTPQLHSASMTELSGSAKLEEVAKIVKILVEDVKTNNLDHKQRESYLEALKNFSRDRINSDPIYTKQGIEILAKYALHSPSASVSQTASKCLSNAMLLEASTRQIFVDLGLMENVCNKLKNDNRDDEFLMSRILLLTTYETNIDLDRLISHNNLAKHIHVNLKRHTDRVVSQEEMIGTNSIDNMALIETLKLMFNLTYFCPQHSGAFNCALKELLILLKKLPVQDKRPLDPPISSVINTIINLDLEKNYSIIFPSLTPNSLIDCCVNLMDKSFKTYEDEELGQNLTPLVILIRKIHHLAPRETKDHLQRLLLPSLEDRQQVLGQSESIASRLLRNISNPMAPQLRDSISVLLFELSEKDAGKFIRNFGYGFASGFLCSNKIPLPDSLQGTLDRSGSDDGEDLSAIVNPVTGQLLEKEEKIEISEMTKEEKEREAERLFVMFDRLEKNGVISVKNPMKDFVHSGKLENLDHESSSE